MAKFVLSSEAYLIDGTEYHRIIADEDFDDIKKGTIGALVQYEEAISQDGKCWADYDSKISGLSAIRGDSKISKSEVINSFIDGNVHISDSRVEYCTAFNNPENRFAIKIDDSNLFSTTIRQDNIDQNIQAHIGHSSISSCSIKGAPRIQNCEVDSSEISDRTTVIFSQIRDRSHILENAKVVNALVNESTICGNTVIFPYNNSVIKYSNISGGIFMDHIVMDGFHTRNM